MSPSSNRELIIWQNYSELMPHKMHDVSEHNFVLWGRNPGDGRTKPRSHAEFVQNVRAWVEKSAAWAE